MRKRLVIILGIVAVLSIAGWFIYQQFTATPQRILTLQGNIDIRQVNVGFRVTGRVKEMKLEEGDVVHAGDLIASLDDVPYQDQERLAQAQANYTKMLNGYRPEEIAQARAQLAQSKANYDNALRYFERQDALQQS